MYRATYNEKNVHVILRQQEKSGYARVEDLVVVRLSAKSQEVREHVHIISASRRRDEHLLEAEDNIPSDLSDLRLILDCIMEHLRGADLFFVVVLRVGLLRAGVGAAGFGMCTRNMKTNLNHFIWGTLGSLFAIINDEFKGDFGPACDV